MLFQDPVHYHDTVFNNIAFGDIDNNPDMNQISAAARAAGADAPISRLPDTYQAVLGKWFGGSELSGGEWQRLALARAEGWPFRVMNLCFLPSDTFDSINR